MINAHNLNHTLSRVTRAENVSGGCCGMKAGGSGISDEYSEMRDKTHLGEGPPH